MNKKILFIFLILVFPVISNAATYYAAQNGSGTTCSSASPCTFSYTLATKSSAGDTIVVYGANEGYGTGTYTDRPSVNKAVTITASPAVISALGTFTRGIPAGTDNRPYFSGSSGSSTFTIGASNAKLSYLKIRGGASPWDDAGPTGIVRVSAYPFDINHCEVYNGGILIMILTSQGVTVTDNRLHNTSDDAPWPFVGRTYSNGQDTHGIAITNYNHTTQATNYTDGIHILRNTIYDVGGNGIQENSWCYAGGQSYRVNYVTIDGNEIYNSFKQNWDSKGTSYVIFSNNISWFGDHSGNANADYGHIAVNAPNDCSSTQMDHWEIYNNIFYGSIRYVAMWNTQDSSSHCTYHHTYNNVMYDNNKSVAYADDPVYKMCGDSNSTFYNNTVVNNVGSVRSGGLETSSSASNVKNNILMNNGADGNLSTHCYKCTNSGTPDHNYFNGTSGWTTGTNAVTSCYATGNCPGFVNLAGNNYYLLPGSPARDAGATLGTPYNVDFAGTSRPRGSGYDIGAFEYSPAPSPPTLQIQ